MLQAKKKLQPGQDGSRIASLCRMLRHRTKPTVTPNKMVSIRNVTTNPPNRPQDKNSSDKENQQLNRNHRRSSTHLGKVSERLVTKNDRSSTSHHAVQKNNCKVHPEREGPYELEGGRNVDFFCDKCAIQLTNQGQRLVLVGGQTKLRKCLEECMNVQLCVVQRAYRELMARLETELVQLERHIRKSYETELQKEQLGSKLQVQLFKPNHLSSDALSRIKSFIGRIQTKTLTSKDLTANKQEQHRESESQLSSSEGVRPFSCRSKHLPTDILIELCNDEPHLESAPPPPPCKHSRNQSTLRHEIQNFLKHCPQ